jgi:hypothetical protein
MCATSAPFAQEVVLVPITSYTLPRTRDQGHQAPQKGPLHRLERSRTTALPSPSQRRMTPQNRDQQTANATSQRLRT